MRAPTTVGSPTATGGREPVCGMRRGAPGPAGRAGGIAPTGRTKRRGTTLRGRRHTAGTMIRSLPAADRTGEVTERLTVSDGRMRTGVPERLSGPARGRRTERPDAPQRTGTVPGRVSKVPGISLPGRGAARRAAEETLRTRSGRKGTERREMRPMLRATVRCASSRATACCGSSSRRWP